MKKELSENAKKLLAALRVKPLHEGDAIKVLFPEPKYIGTLHPDYSEADKADAQSEYWQWEININGIENTRPVLGISTLFLPTANYGAVTREAWKELKDAGLGFSYNNGYNSYTYHLKK